MVAHKASLNAQAHDSKSQANFDAASIALILYHNRRARVGLRYGTDKAQKGLNAIAENGSFRLVAESRCDFLAMFPAADQPADEDNQTNPNDPPGQVQHSATVQPQGPGEKAIASGPGPMPREGSQREPYHARAKRCQWTPESMPQAATPKQVTTAAGAFFPRVGSGTGGGEVQVTFSVHIYRVEWFWSTAHGPQSTGRGRGDLRSEI